MPLIEIECRAPSRTKCYRNLPSGHHFRGYRKCFGCSFAFARDKNGIMKRYIALNFDFDEIVQRVKKARNWRETLKL